MSFFSRCLSLFHTKPNIPPAPSTQQVLRLLRCRETRRYYRRGGWTTDPNNAARFQDEAEAWREVATRKLQNVELVLKIPGSNLELTSGPIG